jgi:two-component system, LytTR family, response regulator
MARIRTYIVEDHAMARDRLVELLAAEPDVEVAGATDSGLDAVDAIRRLRPDLVFLDLQIRDLDGFGVIAAIGHEMPLTILVTAYDEYALRAFDVHAFDYLLKPFGRERFQEAMDRARARLAEGREEQLARRLVSLVQDVGGPKSMPDRLMVKAGGRVVFLQLDELDAIESDGNYVRLHAASREYLVRETMASIESRLGHDRFCRVHRGWIVNLDRVREMHVRPNGEHELVTTEGHRYRVGRAYRESVQARLQMRG